MGADLLTAVASWSTAVPDWRERIMQRRSLLPALPLFDAPAEKALRIFRRLRVPDVVGQPTYGEVCEPWVFDLVRVIFGSYDPETRQRMLQEFFLLVPKKNGKSAIAAGIIVTAAILNERPYAELVLIAPTREIAQIAFKQASGIISLDSDLIALFHIRDFIKLIRHRVSNAEIKILSADGDIVTGSKAAYILIDETHVLAAKQKAPEIFTELRGGLASRPEGFMLQITTQSKMPPAGQFRRELMRARAVRDGRSDHRMLAMLYELPPEIVEAGGWRDEKTWPLVNPNLGRSIQVEWLREQLAAAEADGKDALALFASQHFNVEIGLGLHSDRWIGAEFWEHAAAEGLTLAEIMDTSDICTVGIDGGGLDDLMGLAVVGRHAETREWRGWVKAWAHPEVLDRRKEIAPLLLDFEGDGDLTICATPQQDIEEAVEIVAQLHEAGLLPKERGIGLDPFAIGALVDAMVERGIPQECMNAIRQGVGLSPAVWTAERKLKDGSLRHCGQRMLAWSVTNAKAEQRGNAVYISKQTAGKAKIDPLIALFNAVELMSRNPMENALVTEIPADYRIF